MRTALLVAAALAALGAGAAEALNVPCSAVVLGATELLLVHCAVGPGLCVVVIGQNHGLLFVGSAC